VCQLTLHRCPAKGAELLATYRRDVTLFRNAVLKVAGALGDDSMRAFKEMDRLSQKCKATNEALLAHGVMTVARTTKIQSLRSFSVAPRP
jgi:hypothetical protein